jgi:hypothetical protein
LAASARFESESSFLARTFSTRSRVIATNATAAIAAAMLLVGLRLIHFTVRSRRVGGVA